MHTKLVTAVNTGSTRIPLVEPPEPCENIQGYILRLSELNCYERPRWIYGLIEEDFSNLSFSSLRKCARELPVLTGASDASLQAITYQATEAGNHGRISVGDRFDLSPSMLDIEHPKICPECVQEFGVAASLWDLRAYVACSRHRRYLVDKCATPSCERRLSWWRPYLGYCSKCDEPYRRLSQSPSPDEDLLQYSEMLEERWGTPFTPAGRSRNARIPIDDTDFFRLLRILVSRLREGPTANSRSTSPDEIYVIQRVAASVVDWPRNFDKFLSILMQEDLENGLGFSLLNTSRFGSFFQMVMDRDAKPHLRILQDIVLDFVTRSEFSFQITGKGGNRIANNRRGRLAYLTRSQTMRQLSISAETFRRLFEQGALRGSVLQMGKQHVYRVTAESVKRYQKANR